ncbi:MAG: pilus assembly protein PilP [Gammaproteobacteria bacterium]|nr:pilus assembly protein PilP [Gammaproteobacteria bacterium]
MSDLESYVAEVKSRKSRAIEPIPQMKPYEAFVYIAGERRDPYEPPSGAREVVAGGAGGGIRPDVNRNKEPLEEFPLDALKMIGTILIQDRSYALIQAPDGLVHRVARGDHLGQNFGEILRVSETEVQLLEIIPDGFGGWMQRPASLALAE